MDFLDLLISNATRTLGLILFGLGSVYVAWAGFRYMSSRGDPNAQSQSRLAIGMVFVAMILGAFASVAPGVFGSVLLEPVGLGNFAAKSGCDKLLRQRISPQFTSVGSAARVNWEVQVIQSTYPDDCGSGWEPVALDLGSLSFNPKGAHLPCFWTSPTGTHPDGYQWQGAKSGNLGIPGVPRFGSKGPYLSRSFYQAKRPTGATLRSVPFNRTQRDPARNFIIFFDPNNRPVDDSLCWYFKSDQAVNTWYGVH